MEIADNNSTPQPRPADLARQAIDAICGDVSNNRQKTSSSRKPPATAEKTATCQCCDTENLEMSIMTKIDSGQLLCPQCLIDLRNC